MGSRRNDTHLFLVGEMRVGETRVGEMRRHHNGLEHSTTITEVLLRPLERTSKSHRANSSRPSGF